MKDENNVIETKTEKENKMSDTTKEIEKESNVILSKLSEEQFYQLKHKLSYGIYSFDGFYRWGTGNRLLLTHVKERFNSSKPIVKDNGSVSHSLKDEFLTEDDFFCIVKDYGSVSHSIEVDGGIRVDTDSLVFAKKYDISAEKIEKIGVDEIKKWGDCGDLEEVEENLQSHSIIEYPSSLENDVLEENSDDLLSNAYTHGYGVSVITTVNISIPNREELFPEKLVA